MSFLSNLKLVAADNAGRLEGKQRQRNKLAMKLDEQIAMVTAKQAGTVYAPKRLRSVISSETGQKVMAEMPKRIRPWFWSSSTGGYFFHVRYGSKVIELSKGKNAVEVADAAQLLDALTAVKSAVLAGELDAEIEKASGALRSGFKK